MSTLNGVPFRKIMLPSAKYEIKAPYTMVPKKLTLHETDNQMPAINEANYMISNNNQTSFHYVGDDVEVIQMIPTNRNAWHSGDGGNGYGNRNTIAFEIAQNYDRSRSTTNLLEPLSSKYQKGVENAIKAGAQIMLDNNIVANGDNIRTHNDWNGKWCPRKMLNDGKLLIVKAGIIAEYNRLIGKDVKPAASQSSGKVDGHLTFKQVVDKTIAGGYGSYPAREKNINNKTSFNYKAVQDEVNKRFGVKPKVTTTPTSQPVKTKENLKVDGYLGKETIKALQRYFGTTVDGVISKPSMVVRALQRKVGAKVDGYWGAETTRKLQQYLGTPVDGVISKPSIVIKELQRRLNLGTF